MEPLAFPFRSRGFLHELFAREGLYCLVKRTKEGHSHFEVVKLNVYPQEERFGKLYPEREGYPSSGQWGSAGWTYLFKDEDKARARLKELSLKEDQSRLRARLAIPHSEPATDSTPSGDQQHSAPILLGAGTGVEAPS